VEVSGKLHALAALPPGKEQVEFKVALKRYLNIHSFYSVEKFLTFKNDS
jgi:hypothetical protein